MKKSQRIKSFFLTQFWGLSKMPLRKGTFFLFLLMIFSLMFFDSVLLAEEGMEISSSGGGSYSVRKEFDENFPMETLLGTKSASDNNDRPVLTKKENNDLEDYVENGFLNNDDEEIKFDDAEENISTASANVDLNELEGLIDNSEEKVDSSVNKVRIESEN